MTIEPAGFAEPLACLGPDLDDRHLTIFLNAVEMNR